jgi:hypothetical protein
MNYDIHLLLHLQNVHHRIRHKLLLHLQLLLSKMLLLVVLTRAVFRVKFEKALGS